MKDQIKAQAKKLVSLVAAMTEPMQYQDALEVLAQLHGFRSWQAFSGTLDKMALRGSPTGRLSHSEPEMLEFPGVRTGRFSSHLPQLSNLPKADTDYSSIEARVLALQAGDRKTFHVPDELPYVQDEVPGVGFLYSVPVTVDTSMSTRVLVRAEDKDEAIALARQLVSEGKAPLEVDEGNYRGPADYYCPDDSDGGVYRTHACEDVPEAEVDDGVQVGPFLVEVFHDKGEPVLVMAEVLVYHEAHQENGEPLQLKAITSLAPDCELTEYIEFCRRVARSMNQKFPDLTQVDKDALAEYFREVSKA